MTPPSQDPRAARDPMLPWALLTLGWLTAFAMVLLTLVASRLSLWGDEFDTVLPVFRPWEGHQDFWWYVRRYNANPPGDNLLLRALYRSEAMDWLVPLSPEVFWRIPYMLGLALSVACTFALAWRMTGVAWLALGLAAALLLGPGPFTYAVETRFYMPCILFMTLGTWSVLHWQEDLRSTPRLAAASASVAVGVLFHVALAYLAALLALTAAWDALWGHRRRDRTAAGHGVLALLPLGVLAFELVAWMSFMEGHADAALVFRTLLAHPATLTTGLSDALGWWPPVTAVLLGTLVVAGPWRAATAWKRGDRTPALQAATLLSVLVGGTWLLLLSAAAAGAEAMTRYFLFAVPVFLAALAWLVRPWLPALHRWTPVAVQAPLLVVGLGLGMAVLNHHARTLADASPAKVNLAWARFRDFYRQYPGAGPLVVVGAGTGELESRSDSGLFLGGSHRHYLREFPALFLSTRDGQAAHQDPPSKAEYLFVADGAEDMDRFQQSFPRLPYEQMRCATFRPGLIFCHTTESAVPPSME